MTRNTIDRRTFLLGSGAAVSIAELPTLGARAETIGQPVVPAGIAAPPDRDPAEDRCEWEDLYLMPPRANILSQ